MKPLSNTKLPGRVGLALGGLLLLVGGLECWRSNQPAAERFPSKFFDALFLMGLPLLAAGGGLIWLVIRSPETFSRRVPDVRTPKVLLGAGIVLFIATLLSRLIPEGGLFVILLGPPAVTLLALGGAVYLWRRRHQRA